MDIIFFIAIAIFIYVLWKGKIHIDIPSFFHSTLPLDIGLFGVYCFTGKQGTGKTYALNKFIRKKAEGKKIYSNLTLFDIDYTHLNTLEEMLDLRDQKNCYIIYDEIFTLMTKGNRMSDTMQEFLSQQRKMKNIFITTAQEWLNIPIEFRRYVRVQIECSTRPLGRFGGIMNEVYNDATKIKWDQLQNEYISPTISSKVSKYEKKYMITYDTNERIRKLK